MQLRAREVDRPTRRAWFSTLPPDVATDCDRSNCDDSAAASALPDEHGPTPKRQLERLRAHTKAQKHIVFAMLDGVLQQP